VCSEFMWIRPRGCAVNSCGSGRAGVQWLLWIRPRGCAVNSCGPSRGGAQWIHVDQAERVCSEFMWIRPRGRAWSPTSSYLSATLSSWSCYVVYASWRLCNEMCVREVNYPSIYIQYCYRPYAGWCITDLLPHSTNACTVYHVTRHSTGHRPQCLWDSYAAVSLFIVAEVHQFVARPVDGSHVSASLSTSSQEWVELFFYFPLFLCDVDNTTLQFFFTRTSSLLFYRKKNERRTFRILISFFIFFPHVLLYFLAWLNNISFCSSVTSEKSTLTTWRILTLFFSFPHRCLSWFFSQKVR